jgi:solute carrier family 40 (iron-regulated transporter), member 1
MERRSTEGEEAIDMERSDSIEFIAEDVHLLEKETAGGEYDRCLEEEETETAPTVNLLELTEAEGVKKRSTVWLLVCSHVMGQWGDQCWNFLMPLVIAHAFPGLLWPISLVLFVCKAACFSMGPIAGRALDRMPRLRASIICISLQNTGVIFASCLLSAIDYHAQQTNYQWPLKWQLIGLILLSIPASIAEVASVTAGVSVERVWVPAACPPALLPWTNAWLRRVDLILEVTAPLFVAVCLMLINPAWVVLIVGVANAFSAPVEGGFLWLAAQRQPGLGGRPLSTVTSHPHPQEEKIEVEVEEEEEEEESTVEIDVMETVEVDPPAASRWHPRSLLYLVKEWTLAMKDYLHQDVLLVSLAYILLWLTVLSPHGALLTAYLESAMVPFVAIAIFRALGAFLGVASTLLFPLVTDRLKVPVDWASFIFVAGQCGAVLVTTVAFIICMWVKAPVVFEVLWEDTLLANPLNASVTHLRISPESGWYFLWLGLFCLAVVISRMGLYGFCIGESSLVQMYVKEDHRGAVSSVEAALTRGSVLLMFTLGMLLRSTSNFLWLVLLSSISVTIATAMVLYWVIMIRRRRTMTHEVTAT